MTREEIKDLLKLATQCRVMPCDYLEKRKLAIGVIELVKLYRETTGDCETIGE